MKRTNRNELTLAVRSESGHCAVEIGTDDLSAQERKFIFDIVARVQKGGKVSFSLSSSKPGEMAMTFLLADPIPLAAAIHHATTIN